MLLLCSFRTCSLCSLCSCWYSCFVLLLLDASFLFLHFSCVTMMLALSSSVVVGARCGLLLLLSSHYSFPTIPFALFFCTIILHTSTPVVPHIVVFLTLPLLSCCHSFHVALLTPSLLLPFRCLLIRFYCSFHIAILVLLVLLLLCFVWLVWYFPYTYHVQVEVWSSNTNSSTKGFLKKCKQQWEKACVFLCAHFLSIFISHNIFFFNSNFYCP